MPTGWELVYEPKVKSGAKAVGDKSVDNDDDEEDKPPTGNCLLNMDFTE
jgi:hypothetical protein